MSDIVEIVSTSIRVFISLTQTSDLLAIQEFLAAATVSFHILLELRKISYSGCAYIQRFH